jgi:hypothetical protein
MKTPKQGQQNKLYRHSSICKSIRVDNSRYDIYFLMYFNYLSSNTFGNSVINNHN